MDNPLREQTCRHGRFFFSANDNVVGKSMHLYGEWAESEVSLFRQIVREGDVVLEAGSNIGAHTVPLARLSGARGTVLAFEPEHHAHQVLCANLVANGLLNVRVASCALADKVGEIEFPDLDPLQENNFGSASLHSQGVRRGWVQARTIDSLALPRLDFLKADIEGAEPQLLAGARDTIAKHRPVMFLESLNPYTGDASGALKDFLLPLNYRFWHYITPLFNSRNFYGLQFDAFPGIWSFDMLCVPAEKADVHGLDDAQTHPMQCTDPDMWRGARFEYR